MKPNILHITPDFNYACGRSYYVFLLTKYLKKSGYKTTLATNGGDSFERLDDSGIHYRIIKSLKSKSPISFARTITSLKQIILENEIDIIHTHHRYSEFLALHLARSIKKKTIGTVCTSLSLVGRKYNIEYRSDRIIAVSKVIEKMLTERFKIKQEKIELIPNFVDSDEIRTIKTRSTINETDDNYFNILAVGRFHRDKNFELLLKAMKILNDKSYRLLLIGEGPKLNEYIRYIKDNKIDVKIVGPQKSLNNFYLDADVCVLPSNRDPFPNFMLQSGLFSKPFIGADTDGIPELIKDGVNGFLFKSGNADELADVLRKIKQDSSSAGVCAVNLHNDVITGYTQNSIIPKIEKLYANLMK